MEILTNLSELIKQHGREATEQLVQPVEEAITSSGWIARWEYGFPKGYILLQLVAWQARRAPHEH